MIGSRCQIRLRETSGGLEDVTGNFLTATGLNGGSLARGKNCLYTINGGGQLFAGPTPSLETARE